MFLCILCTKKNVHWCELNSIAYSCSLGKIFLFLSSCFATNASIFLQTLATRTDVKLTAINEMYTVCLSSFSTLFNWNDRLHHAVHMGKVNDKLHCQPLLAPHFPSPWFDFFLFLFFFLKQIPFHSQGRNNQPQTSATRLKSAVSWTSILQMPPWTKVRPDQFSFAGHGQCQFLDFAIPQWQWCCFKFGLKHTCNHYFHSHIGPGADDIDSITVWEYSKE